MAMSRSFGGTLFTTRGPMRDLAGGDVLQPRQHPQQGGLPAAGGADQHDELAIRDIDADTVQHLHGAEGFHDIADIDGRHCVSLIGL